MTRNGTGQAAIVNQDGSLSTPTPAGTYVQVYGTGFGPYGPPGADGLKRLAGTVTATLGGAPVTELYAGEAPGWTAGLQQIDVTIPAGTAPGAGPLVLWAGTAQAHGAVTLMVHRGGPGMSGGHPTAPSARHSRPCDSATPACVTRPS